MNYIIKGIYVNRFTMRRNTPMRLIYQQQYKEWLGCYTMIEWIR